jgi:4-amino-4-deoxy-L-arabinose transferase-like glycosyltransferase
MSRAHDGHSERRVAGDVRAVRAAVLFGLLMTAVSEGLAAVGSFTRGPVAAVWLGTALVLSAALWRRRFRWPRGRLGAVFPREFVPAFAVTCILLVLGACLVTALLTAPNNGDVLGYHLARVRHWIQNGTFAHYPTSGVRQISFPMGGSYLVAHLQLLVGGDRLASLPQWLAFTGCILVTASLGRRLAGPRARVTTALACATIPMAVLQASNPQTDLVAAFWLACFVHLVFSTRRPRGWDVVWLGAALGLGLGSKPTVIVFAPPFLAIVALRASVRGWRAAVSVPIVVVLLAVLPTLPNAIRNQRTFGKVMGPDLGVTLRRRDVRTVASNVLRTAALSYPSFAVWRGITWVHTHLLHVDPGDPRTTFPPDSGFEERYVSPLRSADENFASNPVHVTLALAAAGAVALGRGRRRGRSALRGQLALALAAGFFLYCGALSWQPWANRLLLPVVVLSSPLVGWGLAAVSSPWRTAGSALLGILGILCSLTAVRHPLLPPLVVTRPRASLYFADYDAGLGSQYQALLRQTTQRGCARLGLVSSEFAPEYLLWATFDGAGASVQIREVGVDNPSRDARVEVPGADLCGLVTMQRDGSLSYRSLSAPNRLIPDGPR